MISAKQAKEMTTTVRNNTNASSIYIYLQSLEGAIQNAIARGETNIIYGCPTNAIEEEVIKILTGLKYSVKEMKSQAGDIYFFLIISWA